MDIQKRLTRRPLTTVLWIVVVTAMTVLLIVGCVLMYSSGSLVGILDDYHTSIAVRTDPASWEVATPWGYNVVEWEDKSFTEEDAAYFESLECVDAVYFNTLSGAYSPSFVPLISAGAYHQADESYHDVLVVGEVLRINTDDAYYSEDWGSIDLEVKIEEIILQNVDFTRRKNGFGSENLNISIGFHGKEGAELIQPGQRYVFFGQYQTQEFGLEWPGGEWSFNPWIHNLNTQYQDGRLMYLDYVDYSVEAQIPHLGAPAVTPIDGTFEEFLADPANAEYAELMERWDRQQHSLPVLGTENLNAFPLFVNDEASMIQGRSFTDEEYSSGAKVCVLSESMALNAGLSVGDTITLQQFLCHNLDPDSDYNTSIDFVRGDGMLNNPNVGVFRMGVDYAPEEEFTVVGLYRLRNEWGNGSRAISANTVFIPKSAQIEGAWGGTSWEEVVDEWEDDQGNTYTEVKEFTGGTFGVYFTLKLKNGHISEFEDLMADDERFSNQFIITDQGFGAIMESLNAINASTWKLLGMVLAGWALLLALYTLLYQGMQRKNLGIMRSLGAPAGTAGSYLWGSGMTVVGIGVALGTVISGFLMNAVQNRLFETAFGVEANRYSSSVLSQDALDMMVSESQLPLWALAAIAAVQLAVFAAVLWLQARGLSKKPPRALMSK